MMDAALIRRMPEKIPLPPIYGNEVVEVLAAVQHETLQQCGALNSYLASTALFPVPMSWRASRSLSARLMTRCPLIPDQLVSD